MKKHPIDLDLQRLPFEAKTRLLIKIINFLFPKQITNKSISLLFYKIKHKPSTIRNQSENAPYSN